MGTFSLKLSVFTGLPERKCTHVPFFFICLTTVFIHSHALNKLATPWGTNSYLLLFCFRENIVYFQLEALVGKLTCRKNKSIALQPHTHIHAPFPAGKLSLQRQGMLVTTAGNESQTQAIILAEVCISIYST